MPQPESYVTPHIKELFKPQFATQDPDIYAVLLKAWQNFAEGHIRWPKASPVPHDLPATVSYACNYILIELQSQLPAGLSFIFVEAWSLTELWVRVAEISPFQTSLEVVGSREGQGLILKYAVAAPARQHLQSIPSRGWNPLERIADGRHPLASNSPWESPGTPPDIA